MITVRKAGDRGAAQFGWLDSRHSFSFGNYFDPEQMGHGPLRVINEDTVIPGAGFDEHGHRDMEIISYVLEGGLEHRDSIGNGSVIRPGEVQRMTAGSGIRHSEYNASSEDPVRFLQIWIIPERDGLEPGYEQREFAAPENGLGLIGSRDGRGGSVTIHRDVDLYVARLSNGAAVTHTLAPGRVVWIQVARGGARVNGAALSAGDGAAIADETAVELTEGDDVELLLFDMAA